MMEEYTMLLEIVNDLLQKGYTIDFNLIENLDLFRETGLSSTDFEIDEVYMVRDETNSQLPLLVFAISSKKYPVKGIVLNAITQRGPSSIAMGIKKIFKSIFKS